MDANIIFTADKELANKLNFTIAIVTIDQGKLHTTWNVLNHIAYF